MAGTNDILRRLMQRTFLQRLALVPSFIGELSQLRAESNRLRVEREILRAELDSLRRLPVVLPSAELGSDGSPRPAPGPPPVASEGLLF